MYRSESYDKFISKQLQDEPEFAREYILSSMKEDKLSLVDALKLMISKMGVSEFAKLADSHRSNISRFISTDEIPKLETLNRYLAPFKLRAKLEVELVA